MNMGLTQKLIVGILIVSIQPALAAQDYKPRLDTALEEIKSYLAEKKPDWRHEAVAPIQGSRNVSVNNWAFEGRIVRVSIMAHGSEDEAITAMRRFAAEEREHSTGCHTCATAGIRGVWAGRILRSGKAT